MTRNSKICVSVRQKLNKTTFAMHLSNGKKKSNETNVISAQEPNIKCMTVIFLLLNLDEICVKIGAVGIN